MRVVPKEGALQTLNLDGLEGGVPYYVWVIAEKDGTAGVFGESATGTPKEVLFDKGTLGPKLIAGTDHDVKTAVYIEVNDENPLNAGSYILDDGTLLFDHVILFAANIRSRDCADDPAANGGCTETGVHVHFNENVKYILDNRTKYIKPLQDKGIKVLLGLLGDHDGIGFSTMNDEELDTFMADMAEDVNAYELDGVDFDDEWASKEEWSDPGVPGDGAPNWIGGQPPATSIWPYPVSTWGWPITVTVYRDPTKPIGPGNGTLTAPSEAEQDRMWLELGQTYYKTLKAAREALGDDKVISLYEYNTGRYISPEGAANGDATASGLEGIIDFALQPWYNQYIEDSANGLPRSIYSPFGMDLGGEAYAAQNGAPNPPIAINGNEQAANTIYDYATRFKDAAATKAYNMLYFYGLEPSSQQLKYVSSDSAASVTKERYLSMMTGIVFGQGTVITTEGADHRKDW
jgi:hypothetical protein